jgi:hypothetical protein
MRRTLGHADKVPEWATPIGANLAAVRSEEQAHEDCGGFPPARRNTTTQQSGPAA